MTYSEAVEYISKVYWTERTRGLSRITELLERLGAPQNKLQFIHVAGTNGKGSVSSMLECIFRTAGYKTGLFTSPHLVKYNERIKVNGTDIPDEDFTKIARMIRDKADCMTERPTVFENLTAMGMLYFAEQKCDIVILEVGMGGEFDSTNIIKQPLCSVIGAIGFDHMKELGNTLPLIASAKAGIIKKNCPAVVLNQKEEVLQVFRLRAKEQQSEIHVAEYKDYRVISENIHHQLIELAPGTEPLQLSLAGRYQIQNLSLVLSCIKIINDNLYKTFIGSRPINVPEQVIRKALINVKWAARFEVLCERPVFILDGAHNEHGVNAVLSSLENLFPNRKYKFILGVLQDKNFSEMVDDICRKSVCIYTLQPDSGRALDVECLSSIIRTHNIKCTECSTVPEAIDKAFEEAAEEDIIVSLGSLYLAGEVRTYVTNRLNKEKQ